MFEEFFQLIENAIEMWMNFILYDGGVDARERKFARSNPNSGDRNATPINTPWITPKHYLSQRKSARVDRRTPIPVDRPQDDILTSSKLRKARFLKQRHIRANFFP